MAAYKSKPTVLADVGKKNVLNFYTQLFCGINTKKHYLKTKTVLFVGGVGGIRTRVPLITATRFPVVLVMTTSIPLHRLI